MSIQASEARLKPDRSRFGHQIVQFDHSPGVADLDALLRAGFTVAGAVPDNALVVFSSAGGAVAGQVAGVRWQGQLEASDKVSPILGSDPEQLLNVIVEFHMGVDRATQQAVAAADGIALVRPDRLLPQHALAKVLPGRLRALATHDEVAYIFPADPGLSSGGPDGSELMPCAGMLTLAGPIAQYANIVHGWDLDPDHAAHLGYAFESLTDKVPASTVKSEILRAMNAWSAVTNVIFTAASTTTAARTVAVKFASGPHGDAYPFDGTGGILAHTFYPVPVNSESIAGDVHLDADENWHAGGDLDIYSVVLHEMGHALGLGHSDKPGDVMYPYYRRGLQLSPNDIGAVTALYGLLAGPAGSAAPNPSAPSTPTGSSSRLNLTLDTIAPPGQSAQTAISGTVSGGTPPLSLQYQTDHGYSGTVTTADSGVWSATAVSLATGSNTITVTAFDSQMQTASQSAVVMRDAASTGSGSSPVRVKITSPSSSLSTAKGTSISLAGTATGGSGITGVEWQNSTGTKGSATGTDHWVATNVPLLAGTNTILVKGYDSNGASGWAAVVVTLP